MNRKIIAQDVPTDKHFMRSKIFLEYTLLSILIKMSQELCDGRKI
ncbi:MAG: hypothetical protein WAW45_06140 [Atribacterota bacterium]